MAIEGVVTGVTTAAAFALARRFLAAPLFGRHMADLAARYDADLDPAWRLSAFLDGTPDEPPPEEQQALLVLERERAMAIDNLVAAGRLTDDEAARLKRCPPPIDLLGGIPLPHTGEPCGSRLCPYCYARGVLDGLRRLGLFAAWREQPAVCLCYRHVQRHLPSPEAVDLLRFLILHDICSQAEEGSLLLTLTAQPPHLGERNDELVFSALTLPPRGVGAPLITAPPRFLARTIIAAGDEDALCGVLADAFAFPTHAVCPSLTGLHSGGML